jgi:hypothetical protein
MAWNLNCGVPMALKPILDHELDVIAGGRLTTPKEERPRQPRRPSIGQRLENLCRQHWLARMGLKRDRPEYRQACDLLEGMRNR